ncbi:hypothetical protein WJX74_004757 [Apatococcus lobatus]|uniref:Enkurin domain-containing protein n=1 Tax=Apatococcus lobatus TaxID=904363 RepID=A0AAW1RJD3_9CHLO
MEPEAESIYSLIPRPQPAVIKPGRYRSKHPGTINARQFVMGVKQAREHATFGLPGGQLAEPPAKFLKSHQKEPLLPTPGPPHHERMLRKSSVPSRTEKPQMGLVSQKNFVTANAIENILAKPKVHDTSERLYILKPDFGEVPAYLQRNREQIQQERQQAVTMAPSSEMSMQEREELVGQLKEKWAVVNEAYQKLPFSLDTPTKKRRKEELEKQLGQLEKDIKLLSRGDRLLVVDD